MRIHFTPRDLARTTVATTAAPVLEVLLSLQRLRRQDGGLAFERWRRWVLATVSSDRLRPLLKLAGAGGFPEGVAETADLGTALAGRPDAAPARATATEAGAGWEALPVEALREYHETAIRPYWRSISAQVTTENAQLGDCLAWQGVDPALSMLHPRIIWAAPVLHVLDLAGPDLFLGGRGIKLQLSVFCWHAPTRLLDPAGPPVLVLPVHQAPTLLRLAGTEPPRALAAVLGPTRAAALDAAMVPCTTTELARRCNITPSAASYHAAILREAGLISSSRVRSTVLHQTTPLGRRLLSGSPAAANPA